MVERHIANVKIRVRISVVAPSITFMERCPRGLWCSLGKRVYGNVPGVRIPLSPPNFAKAAKR